MPFNPFRSFAFKTRKHKDSKPKGPVEKVPAHLDPARHQAPCSDMDDEELSLNLGTIKSTFNLKDGTWINHVSDKDQDQAGVAKIIRLRKEYEESEAEIQLLHAGNDDLVKEIANINTEFGELKIEVERLRGIVAEGPLPNPAQNHRTDAAMSNSNIQKSKRHKKSIKVKSAKL